MELEIFFVVCVYLAGFLTAIGCTKLMRKKVVAAANRERQEPSSSEDLIRENKLRTVGTLAAGIAHELGTPLNIVSGRAEMVLSQNLKPEEINATARIIKDQTNRMTAIIRQLLDFSRVSPFQKRPIDIWILIRQTQDLLEPIARRNNVAFLIPSNPPSCPCNVDSGKIQQVFMNLFINSIQAMQDGGTLSVEIQIPQPDKAQNLDDEMAQFIEIKIKDTGHGIDEISLGRLFEPFFTTKDIGQGTGLGLSIVYGILKEHGGKIEISSQQWQGTCCRILLPR